MILNTNAPIFRHYNNNIMRRHIFSFLQLIHKSSQHLRMPERLYSHLSAARFINFLPRFNSTSTAEQGKLKLPKKTTTVTIKTKQTPTTSFSDYKSELKRKNERWTKMLAEHKIDPLIRELSAELEKDANFLVYQRLLHAYAVKQDEDGQNRKGNKETLVKRATEMDSIFDNMALLSGPPVDGIVMRPTASDYLVLLSALRHAKLIHRIKKRFAEMKQHHLRLDTNLYNNVLAALIENDAPFSEIKALFEQMKSEARYSTHTNPHFRCEPNASTYTAMLWACERLQEPEAALQLFNEMKALGLAGNAAELQNNSYAAITALNHTIGACSKSPGYEERAFALFNEAVQMGIQNEYTYSSIFPACLRADLGGIVRLRELWTAMKRDSRIQPGIVLYCSFIQIAAQMGDIDSVMAAYEDIRTTRDMRVHWDVVEALLLNGRGAMVHALIEDLQRRDLWHPNIGILVKLFAMYRRVPRYEDAWKIWRELQHHSSQLVLPVYERALEVALMLGDPERALEVLLALRKRIAQPDAQFEDERRRLVQVLPTLIDVLIGISRAQARTDLTTTLLREKEAVLAEQGQKPPSTTVDSNSSIQ